MKKLYRRSISGLLALLICFTAILGSGMTTYAAAFTEETADSYSVAFPRDGDANLDYSGTWGHDELHYMNGWTSGEATWMTTLHTIGSFDGPACYCIEPGVPRNLYRSYESYGEDYHRTGKDYYEMRTVSDELCREYGLSVVEKPRPGKAKHYGEWWAEQEQRPTWRGLIRSEIDELIRESVSEKQFYYLLRQKGYAVKFGKDISVRPPGKERFVRLARNFGEAYTEDGIRRRILSQPLPQVPHPETPKERKKVYSMGKWQKMRKITGFRALYLYYCYKLGVFPKRRPQNRARLHFLLREDLIKLNNISQEVRLLARHHIDTAEQLALYKKEQEVQITTLSAQRRALQKALRTKFVRDSPEQADAHRAQIRELSERLKALRREVHLCDDIAERSGVMAEKLKAVREDEKNQQKEEQQHEHIR
ncbi:MAG: hypothetical protein ACLTDZ_05670 [Oscillospiraceae bacterium]